MQQDSQKSFVPRRLKIEKTVKFISAGILLFFVVASVLSLIALRDLKTEYDIEQFTNPHHTLYKESKNVKKRFHIVQDQPLVVVLKNSENSWATPQQMARLQKITEETGKIENVLESRSVSNSDTAIISDSTFTVGLVKDYIEDKTLQASLTKDPLIAPHYISTDGRYASLVVEIPHTFAPEAKDKVINAIAAMLDKEKDITYQMGGPAAVVSEMSKLLTQEIVVYSIMSVLAAAVVFFMLFQSFRIIALCLVVIMITNLISMAWLAVFGLPLTLLSCSIPIMVTLTVIAILSHNLTFFSEYPAKVVAKHKQLIIIMLNKRLFLSHWLVTVTTCIGFSTLFWSELPVMHSYALSSIIALISATAVCMVLFAAGLVWIPFPKKRKWSVKPDFFSGTILRHQKSLFAGIVIACVIGMSLSGSLNWSTRLFDDLPLGHPSRVATEAAENHFGGVVPMDISIGFPKEPYFWKKQTNIQKLDELVKNWRHKYGVGGIVALSDFINASRRSRSTASAESVAEGSDKSVAETYLLYSMADTDPLENFTSNENTFARVNLRLKDVPSGRTQELIEDIKRDIASVFPGSETYFSGLGAFTHAVNQDVSRNLIFGFNWAMVFIVLLLVFVFRSLRWAMVAIIPNLVAPSMLMGLMALSATPIKPGIAIVFTISLGIAFGNSVYILMELRDMLRRKPETESLPIRALLNHELGPCFNSAMAAMAIFSVFMFSSMSTNKTFGVFMIISVFTGMLGDLILMPAALNMFPRLLLKKIKK